MGGAEDAPPLENTPMTQPERPPPPEVEPHWFDERRRTDGEEPADELETPSLLSCFDALGQLLRRGFFVALIAALAPALAHAGAPAKVWINGNDIDGPPPGPEHVPQHLGIAFWPVSATSKIKAQRTGAATATTRLEDEMGVNASLFAHHGYWWGQVDILRLEQATRDPFVLAGTGFASGATLGQAAVVTRVAREMVRFDMPWGAHYHADFGFRYTLTGFSVGNGTERQSRNQGFLSPEVSLVGVKPCSDRSAIHTRTSIATNGASTGRETSIDWAITYNTHVYESAEGVHDVAIGLRGLTSTLGYTDKGTGQETTFKDSYLGPELSYVCRW